MKECVMGKFKVLEVKNVRLIQVSKQIEKELINFIPKKKWLQTEVLNELEMFLKKVYDGKYKKWIERVDIGRGNIIAIYHHSQFPRAEVFDVFFDKNTGLFIRHLYDRVVENFQIELETEIINRMNERGFTERTIERDDEITRIVKNLTVRFEKKGPYTYDMEEEKKGTGKSKDLKKIAIIDFGNKNIRRFTTGYYDKKGVKGKEKEGHTTDDTREIAPILFAYKILKKTPDAKNLGVSEKSLDSIKKKYEEFATSDIIEHRKKVKLAEYQGEVIAEIIKANPNYEIYRGGKNTIYSQIRFKGRDLYKKETGNSIDVNNYTPADFIMSKFNTPPSAEKLTEYNNKFANDLLKNGIIGKVSPEHPLIGISQKESEESRGGAAKQFFSIVKKDIYGTIKIPDASKINIDKMYKDINAKLKDYDFIQLETDEGRQFIDAATANDDTKQITYELFKMVENLVTGGKGIKAGNIKPEYFLELVEFAIAANPDLNPCFYKLIAADIEAFNNERFEISLNIGGKEKIIVKYSKSAKEILLNIPIFVTIDTGEGFRKKKLYKVRLPFTVTTDGIVPNVHRLENMESATIDDTINVIAGKKQLNSISHLKAMGYGEKEFQELQSIYETGIRPRWLKRYRELVYTFILRRISKVKDADIQKELKIEIGTELEHIKTGKEDHNEAASAYKHILNNLFQNEKSGVIWDDENKKYIFESAVTSSEKKIDEFLEKL